MDFFQRLGNFFGGKGWVSDEERKRKEQQVAPPVQTQKTVTFNHPQNKQINFGGVNNDPFKQKSPAEQFGLNKTNTQPSIQDTVKSVTPTTQPTNTSKNDSPLVSEQKKTPTLDWSSAQQKANTRPLAQSRISNPYNQDMPKTPAQQIIQRETTPTPDEQQRMPKILNTQGQQAWLANDRKTRQVQKAVNKGIEPPKKPGFFDYLNPLGEYGLFGARQQKLARDTLEKPITNTMKSYENWVDSSDKEKGFQWNDLGDYLRFGAKLPSGMATGLAEAPRKISETASGVRVNDNNQVEKLNAIQRIGTGADAGISIGGLALGGSGTLIRSLAGQGVKQALNQGAKQGAKQMLLNGAKNIAKDAAKEGLEEGVQAFAQDLSDDGKVNTDWRTYRDAVTLGALGGGMMSGAGRGVSAVHNAYNNRVNNFIANNVASYMVNPYATSRRSVAQTNLVNAINNKADSPVDFGALSKKKFNQVNELLSANGQPMLESRNVKVYPAVVDKLIQKRVGLDGMTPQQVADVAYSAVHARNSRVIPSRYPHIAAFTKAQTDGAVPFATLAGYNGEASLKSAYKKPLANSLADVERNVVSGESTQITPSENARLAPNNRSIEVADRQLADNFTGATTGDSVANNSENVNTNTSQKQSQSRIFTQNQNYSHEANAAIDKLSREYDPIINAELEERAEANIEASGGLENAHMRAMESLKKGDSITPEEKATALKTLQILGEQSDPDSMDRFASLSARLAETSRNQAQLLQLNRILRKQTPTGMLNNAVRSIERAGGEVTPEVVAETKELIAGVKSYDHRLRELQNEIEEAYARDSYSEQIKTMERNRKRYARILLTSKKDVTKAKYQGLIDILNKSIKDTKRKLSIENEQKIATIRQLGEQMQILTEQQGYASSRLGEYISRQSPSHNKLGSVYRASLLSSVKTQTKNFVSNALNLATNKVVDLVAKPIDWVMGAATGRDSISATTKGSVAGLKSGLRQSGHLLKTGESARLGENLYEGTGQGELHFQSKLADTLFGAPSRGVFRVVEAGDKPFRNIMRVNTLYQEAAVDAMNQGLKGQDLQLYVERAVANPSTDLMARAEARGADVVFGSRNVLSDGINKIQQTVKPKETDALGVRAAKKTAQIILDTTMPFVKVPTNVAIKGFYEYNLPGGLVGALNAAGKVAKGSFTQADQAKLARTLAKTLIGSSAMYAGYSLAKEGLITGGYPEDEKERARWEAEGITPNSIRIGDKWVQLGPLTLLFTPAMMGANVHERQKGGADMLSALAGAQLDSLNSLKELPVLTGVKDLVELGMGDNYGNPGLLNMNGENMGREAEALLTFAGDKLMGLIPNIVRSAATSTDDKVRQVGYGNLEENFRSRIPGLRQTLPVKVDAFGNELNNQSWLTGFVDPLSVSTARQTDNAMYAELDRLAGTVGEISKDKQGNLNAWKERIKQSSGIKDENGQNIKFNSEQRMEAQRQIGQATAERYRAVMSTDEYRMGDDQKKYDMLKEAAGNVGQESIKKGVLNNQNVTDNPLSAYDMYVKDYKLKVLGEGKNDGGKFGVLEAEAGTVTEKDIARQAIALFKDKKYDEVPEEIKREYLKRNKISSENTIHYDPGGQMADDNGNISPIDYAIASSYKTETKDKVISADISRISDRNQMLGYLANGRRKSIAGDYWVTNSTLDSLYEQGVISYEERRNLKSITDIDQNGDYQTKGSAGRSGRKRSSSGGSSVRLGENDAAKAANNVALSLNSFARNSVARPNSLQFSGRAVDLQKLLRGRSNRVTSRSRAVTFH